jgi:hypothetical protein
LSSAAWLAIGQATVQADAIITYSNGNNQGTADFSISGNNRVITLTNNFAPASNFQFVQTDVLGGLAFGTSGTAPNLTLVSAFTTSTIWTGDLTTKKSIKEVVSGYTNTNSPGADVGYSWAGSTNSGISASGHGLPFAAFSFGAVNNLTLFNTGKLPSNYPNTNGTQPDGVDFGLMPQNTKNFTHDHFIGQSFIQSSVVLTFGGWNGADLSSINGAEFFWGTSIDGSEPESGFIPNPLSSTPEPTSFLLMGGLLGGLGLFRYCRRERRQLAV